MNLYIYGPPGCGKTTIGMQLAERMGWHFIDTDKLIENEAGLPITEIFRQKGEADFRLREKALLSNLVNSTRTVIALGGGTLVDDENRALVESSGTVVCLMCEPEAILTRMGDELYARPLLVGSGPLERLKALLAKRAALYASFPLSLDTTPLPPEDVVRKVQLLSGIFRLEAMGGGYDVIINRGLLPRLRAELEERKLGAPFVIVSDSNVAPLYAQPILEALAPAGAVSTVVVPAGEAAKTLRTAESIYSDLFERKMERRGTLLALGGGVVTDLGGFAAATFLRGIPWVALPTSLMGMVDAAIGGKTAVDLPQGKNLIGSFYPPAMMLADLDTLATLPSQEMRMGMAEVVKAAMVGDSKLLGIVEKLNGKLDPKSLDGIVRRAGRVKIRVVEEDPFERHGPREALNFGHTIGHALEAWSNYELSHGEAVAIGMVAESKLSEKIGIAEPGLSDSISRILQTLGLPVCHNAPAQQILERIAADKKRRGGRVKWALPITAGKVRIGLEVPEEDVLHTLKSIGCQG